MTVPHRRRLSTVQQAIGLRRLGHGRVDLVRDELRYECELRPTELSRTYTCVVSYRLGTPPVVRVIDPPLAADEDGALPHYYHDTSSLCLYDRGDWTSGMSLAATVIPWTIEWLYFYELWRATGVWHGSGSRQAIPPPRPRPRRGRNVDFRAA